jgi:hypothetical protein
VGDGPPAWLPASIGGAGRRGTASADDLLTGEAWSHLLDRLDNAASVLASSRAPSAPLEQAAGYRHLLVLLALGIDEALRPVDPYAPRIRAGNVDAVLKWGMDCPDALYCGSPVRADAVYRLHGRRGTARYVGLQLMAGMETTANVVVEDDPFEIFISAERRPGWTWMPLAEKASSLVVRQFFYDWATEEAASFEIECLEGPPAAEAGAPSSAAVVARQVEALGEFVDASTRFWIDIEEMGRTQGLNVFREPANRTDMGGAEENVTTWGSWELSADEALVIEVTPPDALYWSVALGNFWWETLDYANRQTSLNGYQAVLDDDGVFRAVVAHEDPGVANWLDTTGFSCGPMIFRWLRASSAPVPSTRVVPLEELEAALPASTARVSSEERQRALAARRAGVHRRFPR